MTQNTDPDENDEESRSKYGIRCGIVTVKEAREALGVSECDRSDDEDEDDE